jgi:hypothetical protein
MIPIYDISLLSALNYPFPYTLLSLSIYPSFCYPFSLCDSLSIIPPGIIPPSPLFRSIFSSLYVFLSQLCMVSITLILILPFYIIRSLLSMNYIWARWGVRLYF